ncbi:MAG: hypothetical protein KDK74_03510 [Cephaloticoccus sp.]|nr:hypothetical protein [Cephaloticoccus sp.]
MINFSRRLITSLKLSALAGTLAWSNVALAESKPREIGDSLQLMMDVSLVDKLSDGIRMVQGTPEFREIVLKSDRPWEGRAFIISSIYQHEGVYHLLYRGHNTDSGDETIRSYYLCLATSTDGITWEKPNLGLVTFKGSKQNNIIGFSDGEAMPFCYTFYDPRPETPADERVKAILMRDGDRRAGGAGKGLRAQVLASADGRVWRDLNLGADLQSDRINAFDGGSVFWSEAEQQFVGYFRWWEVDPPTHDRLLFDWMIGRPGVRTAFRSVSKDLRSWSTPEPMSYGGTPREHIYEASTTPYFRNAELYVVLANRFNPGRRAITLEEERAFDITRFPGNQINPTYTFASDANDMVLLLTKPGETDYQRPFMEAFLRPGTDPRNWTSRNNYTALTGGLIPTGPAEMSFFITRHHLQPGNHIQRVSLRTDGLVSARAGYAGGELTTVPFTYTGDHLVINFATSGAGEVRVELQDAAGNPLPGFSLEECDVLIGDRIDHTVSWQGRESLSGYIGRPVRLKFVMSDADLYSFKFPDGPLGN